MPARRFRTAKASEVTSKPKKSNVSTAKKIKTSKSRIKRRLDLIETSWFSMFSGVKRSRN